MTGGTSFFFFPASFELAFKPDADDAEELDRRKRLGRLGVIGLRLRVRALSDSTLESDVPSFSFSSSINGGDLTRFLATDLVTGPKYPSRPSLWSEGVGDGDITRGVPGIARGCDVAAISSAP